MGAILYPPKGVDYNEWLCDLICGDPEPDDEGEGLQGFLGEEDDRTNKTQEAVARTNQDR